MSEPLPSICTCPTNGRVADCPVAEHRAQWERLDRSVDRGPWAVWVASRRDRNGEPYELTVRLADERHVTEKDAEWLRAVIRDAQR